ncbi:predicted protein [Botrytis cinerea T4]|uniref:Uncharacterized protein n=1 Tax=Botryotinia fuckeliana (strain T4) TaxID=999810 RepID=G2Y8X3_BOTF4|nr:predicted protein [Botrytis cinerea T4]
MSNLTCTRHHEDEGDRQSMDNQWIETSTPETVWGAQTTLRPISITRLFQFQNGLYSPTVIV